MKPALILLSEVRLTSDINDNEVYINGYKIYRTDSESRHTGGAAIYVRSDIIVKKVSRVVFEKNMWLIAINIESNEWNGTVASIYHSPSSDDTAFINENNK